MKLKLLPFTSKRFSLHYERQKEGMIEKGSNRQNGSISGLVLNFYIWLDFKVNLCLKVW